MNTNDQQAAGWSALTADRPYINQRVDAAGQALVSRVRLDAEQAARNLVTAELGSRVADDEPGLVDDVAEMLLGHVRGVLDREGY